MKAVDANLVPQRLIFDTKPTDSLKLLMLSKYLKFSKHLKFPKYLKLSKFLKFSKFLNL